MYSTCIIYGSCVDIAYIAGTSSTHIENHYRHIEDEMMIRGATRNNIQSIEGRFQPD